MRLRTLLESANKPWFENQPIEDFLPYPIDYIDSHYAKTLLQYHDIKNKSTMTNFEAELLMAADDEIVDMLSDYKAENIPIIGHVAQRFVNIIARIAPISEVFYRGVEQSGYDSRHIMPVQSWSVSIHTAKMFGDVIFKNTMPVKGIEIGNVFYWHHVLHTNSNGLGDGQAEWLLIPPPSERV